MIMIRIVISGFVFLCRFLFLLTSFIVITIVIISWHRTVLLSLALHLQSRRPRMIEWMFAEFMHLVLQALLLSQRLFSLASFLSSSQFPFVLDVTAVVLCQSQRVAHHGILTQLLCSALMTVLFIVGAINGMDVHSMLHFLRQCPTIIGKSRFYLSLGYTFVFILTALFVHEYLDLSFLIVLHDGCVDA